MSRSRGIVLAVTEGFGQVYDCGSCGNIHVQVGPVSISLEPQAYMQLVDMISTSAANFELWLELKSSADFSNLEEGEPEDAPDDTNYNEKGIS